MFFDIFKNTISLLNKMMLFHRLRIAVCVTILFSLVLPTSKVSACSCVERGSVVEEFAEYDAVFTGKIVRIVDNYSPIFSTIDNLLVGLDLRPYFFHEDGKFWGYSVFFRVIDSWKGVEKSIVEVDTGYGMGDCGYSFIRDRDYLVYASHAYGIPTDYWVTSICSRTAELAAANEDLDYLNSKPPLSLNYFPPVFWTERDSILLFLISLPAVSLMILGIKFQRKKQVRLHQ